MESGLSVRWVRKVASLGKEVTNFIGVFEDLVTTLIRMELCPKNLADHNMSTIDYVLRIKRCSHG